MRARGLTLIELLVFMFCIASACLGAKIGVDLTKDMGIWWCVAGLFLGGVGGGVAAVAAIFALLLPFEIYAAVRRTREPCDLVCRCHDPGVIVAAHLLPCNPLEQEAIAESRGWNDWSVYRELHLERAPATDRLRDQLRAGTLSEEQLLLAAALGEPAALSLADPPTKPLLNYRHWAKLPAELQLVLRSGLPPRLCMVWAMTCAARALAEFEREFHQDTRPRLRFGLALMALRDENTPDVCEALTKWRRMGWYAGRPSERGCRVLHRTFWERFRGARSRGEEASDAVFRFARAVADYVEPSELWHVYPTGDVANAYETPRNRCIGSLPSHAAEGVAYDSSRAVPSADEELARQRTELARMILGWKRWDEDRLAWQIKIEEVWIPKVEEQAAGLPFNVNSYAAIIRDIHLPWAGRKIAAPSTR